MWYEFLGRYVIKQYHNGTIYVINFSIINVHHCTAFILKLDFALWFSVWDTWVALFQLRVSENTGVWMFPTDHTWKVIAFGQNTCSMWFKIIANHLSLELCWWRHFEVDKSTIEKKWGSNWPLSKLLKG